MGFLTTVMFIYTAFGLISPVDVPDGKGGLIKYMTVGSQTHCLENPIVQNNGKGGFQYFCVVQ